MESNLGQGSSFFFTIQAKVAEGYEKQDTGEKLAEMLGKRILVVDDNLTNCRILELQFQHWGMQAVVVQSGEAALKLLASGERFDLGVIDMQMPGMDGAQLGLAIRELFSKEELPLVMLSSVGKTETVAQLPETVLSAYITKPVKQSQLFECMADLLNGQISEAKAEKKSGGFEYTLDQSLAEQLPLRILLAEDNTVNQKLALRVLEKMGYLADAVANGLEVVEAIKRKRYDIIFMDVQMPEMDGLEATCMLRQMDIRFQPKIIAMTANAMQGDRERCLEAGMDDYISKPIRLTEIQSALIRWGSEIQTKKSPSATRSSERKQSIIQDNMISALKDMGPEIFVELVQLYLEETPHQVAEVRRQFELEDAAGMAAAAHSLKGSSLNLGANSLADICKQIEVKGKKGNLFKVGDLLEQLDLRYQEVQETLAEEIAAVVEKQIQ